MPILAASWQRITEYTEFHRWHILGCQHSYSTWLTDSCPTATLALAMGWTHYMTIAPPKEKSNV